MFLKILIPALFLSLWPSTAQAQEATFRVIRVENDTVCGWEVEMAIFLVRRDTVPKEQLYNVLRTCREIERPTNFLIPEQAKAEPARWNVLRIYLPPSDIILTDQDVEKKVDIEKCTPQFIAVPGVRPVS